MNQKNIDKLIGPLTSFRAGRVGSIVNSELHRCGFILLPVGDQPKFQLNLAVLLVGDGALISISLLAWEFRFS